MKFDIMRCVVIVAMAMTSCGGEDEVDQDGDTGVLCSRSPGDDDQCASMAGTPEFFLCESDGERAPSAACEPLGDTGDYCCPEGTGGGGTDLNGDWWQPAAGLTWDWQLTGPLDLTHDVDVYDIDWETDQATVDALLARGIKLICYVSVGTWEEWRSDADDYPDEAIGPLWPEWDEYFVDIRSEAVRDIVARRMDVCASRGFHALEPDNMDIFELEGDSGFPLNEAIGLEFALWLASEAHARGLAIVQKNASSLTADLVNQYDGVLTEDCFADDWCEEVLAYSEADKPVFMAEYTDTGVDFDAACSFANENGCSPVLKDRDLTDELVSCP
jgi:hypothetical protein